jgi:hypothetical protein
MCLSLLLLTCLLFPAAAAGQTCTADCDGDAAVTVNEIVTVLNIGLGSRLLADCPAGDSTGDGSVTVDEIVAGLNFALNGCATVAPTATATPTPSPTPDGVMRLDVGRGSGLPGSVVRIPITLSQGNGMAIALSADITYDTTHIRVVRTEGVVCAIDPAIGPGSIPNKMLLSNVLSAAPPRETIRIGVIAFENMLPIPDGVVATCDFRIAPAAPPGEVVLDNVPGAADVNSNELPVVGSDGAVTIR